MWISQNNCIPKHKLFRWMSSKASIYVYLFHLSICFLAWKCGASQVLWSMLKCMMWQKYALCSHSSYLQWWKTPKTSPVFHHLQEWIMLLKYRYTQWFSGNRGRIFVLLDQQNSYYKNLITPFWSTNYTYLISL